MKKLAWVDVIKGIGMLCVVVGHVFDGEVSRYMYIFHMPLFFFISGYLFKPTTDYKFYLVKKVKHLLIPYISFLIPLYFLFRSLPTSNISEIGSYFLNPILGGRLLTGPLGGGLVYNMPFFYSTAYECFDFQIQIQKIKLYNGRLFNYQLY